MMNWINKKRNKKGFTLVELVVVIAILGILAAIAVPKFTDVTANAKKAAAESEHKVIVSAFQMFQAASPTNVLPASKTEVAAYLDIKDTATGTDAGTKYITKNATHTIDWTAGKITTTVTGVSGTIAESTLK